VGSYAGFPHFADNLAQTKRETPFTLVAYGPDSGDRLKLASDIRADMGC
jgi:hypothetical protein